MTFVGWSQIAIVLALVLVAAIPLSGLIARSTPASATFYAGAAAGRARLLPPRRGRRDARAKLARLCDGDDRLLDRRLPVALRAAAAAKLLPLNPQGFHARPADLAFNTSISFITNTNWQNYAGETTMSHLTQMLGLTVHNFLSAATGLAMAFALVRAFARSTAQTVGNFWVDMTRVVLYVLLPLSIVIALVMVALGVPQTLAGSVDVTTLEGAKQTIALGPMAGGMNDEAVGVCVCA